MPVTRTARGSTSAVPSLKAYAQATIVKEGLRFNPHFVPHTICANPDVILSQTIESFRREYRALKGMIAESVPQRAEALETTSQYCVVRRYFGHKTQKLLTDMRMLEHSRYYHTHAKGDFGLAKSMDRNPNYYSRIFEEVALNKFCDARYSEEFIKDKFRIFGGAKAIQASMDANA